MLNWNGSGMSVMEMSHRSSAFASIFQDTKDRLRRLLQVPEEYEILFLQGGATTQFSMVPMNLMGRTGKASYALTGNFSTKAYEEAQKFGQCLVACSSADKNHTYIPAQEALSVTATLPISTTAPTTPSTARSGTTSLRPGTSPWCAT